MAKVIGFGGVFLRAKDPKALYAWYGEHLGLESSNGCFTFPPDGQRADSVVSFFTLASDYFPTSQPAMLNLQVDDLEAIRNKLLSAGVSVDPKMESFEYGKFGWFTDPEGNRVELWQPA